MDYFAAEMATSIDIKNWYLRPLYNYTVITRANEAQAKVKTDKCKTAEILVTTSL
jgi:hypothetical protein